MFQNNLNPPPQKSFTTDFFVQTMTADDATMNVIILIHILPSSNHFKRTLNSFNLYLKDYPTHEGVNSHMASVRVYPLTS